MTNDLLPDDISARRPCGSIGPQDEGATVVVAGFVEDLRNLGNLAFLTLRDRSGKVQLTLLKKKMPEIFALAAGISRESVVAATAKVQKSDKANAGFELLPSHLRLLGAADTPLPLGPADAVGVEVETALNNRFLDLRRPQTMAVFVCRAAILRGDAQDRFDRDRGGRGIVPHAVLRAQGLPQPIPAALQTDPDGKWPRSRLGDRSSVPR